MRKARNKASIQGMIWQRISEESERELRERIKGRISERKASQKSIRSLYKIYSIHARQSPGIRRTHHKHEQPFFLVPILTIIP